MSTYSLRLYNVLVPIARPLKSLQMSLTQYLKGNSLLVRSPPPARKAERPPPQEGGNILILNNYTSLLRGRSSCFELGWGRSIGTIATCQAQSLIYCPNIFNIVQTVRGINPLSDFYQDRLELISAPPLRSCVTSVK